MDSSDISIFRREGVDIRSVIVAGEPWFVAADVTRALGYKNGRDAVARHTKHTQRGVSRFPTPSAVQELTIISEAGVYRLVMRSNNADAVDFQDWLAIEVIPRADHLPARLGSRGCRTGYRAAGANRGARSTAPAAGCRMSAADRLALRNVLWHFGDYARGKGTTPFMDALLAAIEEATAVDLEKLRLVYPELVDFVTIAKRDGGLDELRDAVRL